MNRFVSFCAVKHKEIPIWNWLVDYLGGMDHNLNFSNVASNAYYHKKSTI